MRTLAVDWGIKRTGLAICDELAIVVRPLTTLKASPEEVIKKITELIEDYQIQEIVVGIPLHADGTLGDMAKEVLLFVEKLQLAVNCPVKTWNERLTSHAAEEWMNEHKLALNKRKDRLDEIAAAILLEDYLATQNTPNV